MLSNLNRRRLLTGAAALAAYGGIRSAEAQFNGCPPGFCPGNLLGGAGNSPIGPILAPYTGQVATRSSAPVSVTGTPSSALFANSSSWHYARDNISSLQIILPNFTRNGSGDEATTGGNIVYRASIEYPIGANKQSFLFSGSAAATSQ